MSPSSRSLQYLKKEGYVAQSVEKYNFFTKRRLDLFNFADIVAIKQGEQGVLAIQVTTNSNISAHLTKIKANEIVKLWINCGNKLQIHGWAKKGKIGKRKTWQLKVLDMGEIM